ncbi:MAG: aminotransferase, partial [Bosea sp. (in: a-proteobacteria)]
TKPPLAKFPHLPLSAIMNAPLLNSLLLDTGTPPIPAAKSWLAAYDGRNGQAIDLSQAAPGSAPPDALLQMAAKAAGSADAARYGPIMGDMDLRQAFAADLLSTYGAPVTPTNIAITAGCNQAFVTVAMALAKAGDAIIVPVPWYFNHQMTLNMLGIEARALPTHAEHGFVPDVEAARALIDAKVKAIVLVTPNNPTGAVYPPDVIAAFAALCREAGIMLVLDETYRDFLPASAGQPHTLFQDADWKQNVIQLYSFSKSYAVPGWRLGTIVAGETVQAEIGKVLDCVQICPSRAGQQAVAWGIEALRDWREANRSDINARATAFRRAMSGLNGWSVDQSGAYFAYVRHPFGETPAAQVAEMLARRWGVLALPGSYFGPGQDGHLRMAFANVTTPAIADAVARLALMRRG